MTSTLDLRPLEPRDLAACLKLWRAAADEAHDFLTSRELDEEAAYVAAAMRQGADTIVASSAGRPVAFIALCGPTIAGLFVAPDLQGRGVGRALLRAAVTAGRARAVEVYVRNTRAVGFYRSEGYVEVGLRPTDDLGRQHELLCLLMGHPRPLARPIGNG